MICICKSISLLISLCLGTRSPWIDPGPSFLCRWSFDQPRDLLPLLHYSSCHLFLLRSPKKLTSTDMTEFVHQCPTKYNPIFLISAEGASTILSESPYCVPVLNPGFPKCYQCEFNLVLAALACRFQLLYLSRLSLPQKVKYSIITFWCDSFFRRSSSNCR